MRNKYFIIFLLVAVCLFLIQIMPIFSSTSTTSSEVPPKPDILTFACWEIGGNAYAQHAIFGELMQKKIWY